MRIKQARANHMNENIKKLESLDYRPPDPAANNSPNENIMIISQAEGAVKIVLNLLENLKPKNKQQEDDKQGCIWTLRGWKDNNLRHLIAAFE